MVQKQARRGPSARPTRGRGRAARLTPLVEGLSADILDGVSSEALLATLRSPGADDKTQPLALLAVAFFEALDAVVEACDDPAEAEEMLLGFCESVSDPALAEVLAESQQWLTTRSARRDERAGRSSSSAGHAKPR